MPEDFRFEAALSAALSVVHTLSLTPRMPRQQELATVTYAVLEAIRQVEERLRVEGSQLPAPVASAGSTVRVRLSVPGRVSVDRTHDDRLQLPGPEQSSFYC